MQLSNKFWPDAGAKLKAGSRIKSVHTPDLQIHDQIPGRYTYFDVSTEHFMKLEKRFTYKSF